MLLCAAINHGEKPLKMKTKSAFVYFRETQSGDVTTTAATSGIAASVRKIERESRIRRISPAGSGQKQNKRSVSLLLPKNKLAR